MRMLLDSSWMRFGAAGYGLDEWATEPPLTQEQQSNNWTDLEAEEDRSLELTLYIFFPVVSIFLLVLLDGLIRQHCFHYKLNLANIFSLDIQAADGNPEFFASLTRDAERHTSTSSDGSDGVFVMVYLPHPYEESLSKITRAASVSSSKDVESIKIDDLEAMLCPDLKRKWHCV